VVVFRDDVTGAAGYTVLSPADRASAVYGLLRDSGADPEPVTPEALRGRSGTLGSRVRLRAIGWHAFNVARIEAGRPLYNIDFGPDSLPAQSGVLHERVSFTKGCYLGQEVVARMHSRGHSKSLLVSVRVERVKIEAAPAADATEESRPEQYVQPGTGAALFVPPAPGAAVGAPVGAVTSSCVSPLLGSAPICLAQVKQEAAKAGSAVLVEAEGQLLRGEVRERLSVLDGAP
jgi:folate-binding protein YgfZ